MKAKPYRVEKDDESGTRWVECDPAVATYVLLQMPGPFPNRMLPVILKGSRDAHGHPVWSWNGDTERPTLRPSVRTSDGELGNVCHSWINDGKIQFLDDCTHEFRGQTLDLLEVDYVP